MYFKQSQSVSTASSDATSSPFTIAGIGQPVLTTLYPPTTTTEGNDIGNLTKEVDNNVENRIVSPTDNTTGNSTAMDDTTGGNMTTEQVSSK